jgi:hypothetical protein
MIPSVRSLKLKRIVAFEARPSASICAGLSGSLRVRSKRMFWDFLEAQVILTRAAKIRPLAVAQDPVSNDSRKLLQSEHYKIHL